MTRFLNPGYRLALSLAFVSGLTGCGGGPYTATVSGKVTYRGKPLEDGWVAFVHPDGRFAKAMIQPDGTYSSPEVPGGQVKVTVISEPTPPPLPPGARLPGGTRVPPNPTYMEAVKKALNHARIPDKYRNPDSSGLSLTVNRGSNQFDIPLEEGAAKGKGG